MKIDKENDTVEKQKQEAELKEAKLREVTEAKQIQVGSKMIGGKSDHFQAHFHQQPETPDLISISSY